MKCLKMRERKVSMELTVIFATSLDDAWFQCVRGLIYGTREDEDENTPDDKKYGIHSYEIQQGSWKGDTRLEYDFIVVDIGFPATLPLAPQVPEGVPEPTTDEKIEAYFHRYLMSDVKAENEQYTYGERITMTLEGVMERIKETPMSNQIILQVAEPNDFKLEDPPCLRHIDIRVWDGKLHFFPYFRSWDLYSGFPENLGGLQRMKETIARMCGLQDGKMIATSKGLHLYKSYGIKAAKARLGIS